MDEGAGLRVVLADDPAVLVEDEPALVEEGAEGLVGVQEGGPSPTSRPWPGWGAGSVAGVAGAPACRIMPVIAKAIGGLTLEGPLEKSFRERRPQTSRAGRLQSFGLSADHQLSISRSSSRIHRLRDSDL